MCFVEHCFRTLSYEAVKEAYQMYFVEAAGPNVSIILRLANEGPRFSSGFCECVETGSVMSAAGR